MVGIALAIAALVLVWLQGFTGFGGPAPAADISVLSCNVAADAVTAELASGRSLDAGEVVALLENVSSGTPEARADPLASASLTWEHRARLTISNHEDDEPRWDEALASPGGLAGGTRYEITWIHRPSDAVFTSDRFRCGPEEAPEPTFVLTSCRAQNDDLTVRLTSDQALSRSRWSATLVNRSDGAAEATADPLADQGVWRPGSALTFHEGDQGGGVAWDDDLVRGLEDGGRYRLDFTYDPTGTRQASLGFTC